MITVSDVKIFKGQKQNGDWVYTGRVEVVVELEVTRWALREYPQMGEDAERAVREEVMEMVYGEIRDQAVRVTRAVCEEGRRVSQDTKRILDLLRPLESVGRVDAATGTLVAK